jgi:DNA-binding LacI/PurR family transcriptional regulator
VKIEDISKSLGVSKATVSLAINNRPGISQDTREKVMAFVRESGYISRPMIDSEQKNIYNHTIRFMVCSNPEEDYYESNLSTSFFEKLIQGMEKKCVRHHYALIFSTSSPNNFKNMIEEIAHRQDSAGLVLLATNLKRSEVSFAIKKIPALVVVNNIFEYLHANFVVMNNKMGGYDACSYLIKLGHKNIGYVRSKTRITNFDQRKEGFMRAIQENNLEIPLDHFYTVRNDIKLSQKDFSEVLQKRIKPLPTALFCENDYMAIGVMKALMEHGIRVPEDISIIGFDNVSESIVIHPELTTIHVQKTKMGELAIQALLDLVNSKHSPLTYTKTIIDTYVVERKSCASPCVFQ